jgi:hypothetical protein
MGDLEYIAFQATPTGRKQISSSSSLYGLPEIFFGVALLWIISGPATRRNPKRQNCSKSSLPSWSWMGWQGSIGLRDWFSGGDYLNIRKHSPPYERFHTQWYVHDKASDFKREVSSFWRRYRDHCYLDNGSDIPVGWARYHDDRTATTQSLLVVRSGNL